MSTRRRSDRYVIEVPVWLKDAHGGDRTVTADVSAHGIAILTTKQRPDRQYVELELTLPAPLAKINVTAIVARRIENLPSADGRRGVGLGLDFFLLDSRAKQDWQRFIHVLSGVPSIPVRQEPGVPPRATPPNSHEITSTPPVEAGTRRSRTDGAPTYIIKPRDLGRLWGFFRGELTSGLVRIETPVALPVGAPTELLVVHPTTEAEWTLSGRVASVETAGANGHLVLEIALEGNFGEARSAFRNFVATGQGMIEEDIAFSSDLHRGPIDFSVDLAGASNDVVPELDEPPASEGQISGDEAVPGPLSDDVSVSVDLGDEPVDDPEPSRFDATAGGTRSEVVDIRAALDGEDEVSRSVTDVEAPLSIPLPSDEEPLFDEPPAPVAGDLDEPLRHSDITGAMALPRAFDSKRAPEGDFPTETSIAPEFADDPAGELLKLLSSAPSATSSSPRATSTPPRSAHPLPRLEPLPRRDRPRVEPPTRRDSPAAKRGRLPTPELTSSEMVAADLPPTEAERAEGASGSMAPEKLSGRLFSSFFFEAASARSEKLESARPASDRAETSTKPLDLKSMVPLPIDPNVADAIALLYAPTSDLTSADDDPAIVDAPRSAELSPPRGDEAGQETASLPRGVDPDALDEAPKVDPNLARDLSVARSRLMRSPNSVTACYRLGMLLMRSDDAALEEALYTLHRVTQLEPNHPGAHHALADVLCRRGEVETAAEHLHRAKRLGYQINPQLERQIAEARAQAQDSRK